MSKSKLAKKNWRGVSRKLGVGSLIFIGAFLVAFVAGRGLAPAGDSYADDSDVNVTLEPSLALAVFDKNPSVDASATTIDAITMQVTPNANGVFVSSTAYVQAASNNETGYALTMSDLDDNTDLVYQGSVTGATNISSIATSSTNLTDIELNKWGYAFGVATVFSPVPALSTPAALAQTTAPSTDTYPFTVGTKIDMSMSAGTYQDSVVFTLVANYAPPKTANLTVTPISTYNLAGGDTFTIDTDIDYADELGSVIAYVYSGNYSTSGDKAVCTSPTKVNNGGKLQVTCTSPAKAVGTYNVALDFAANNRVYIANNAVEYMVRPDLSGISNMQDISAEVCGASAIGDSVTLTDTRDNQTYTIKKLADGKCWMTQNLRLASTKAVTLTPADSDVSSNYPLPQAPTTTSSWGSYNVASDVNQTHLYNTQNSSYGVYYNWYTATAGTGLYDNTTTNATSSICPKGWRLPTGGASGDFQTLYTAENSDYNTFMTDGAWVLSGHYFSSGSVYGQGSDGYWWSSTPNPSAAGYAYRLGVYSSNVYPQRYNYKANGVSVRCVAR